MLIDQLHAAILAADDTGLSRYRLCLGAGIDQAHLSRFMKTKSGMSVRSLERVATFLGYDVQLVKKDGR